MDRKAHLGVGMPFPFRPRGGRISFVRHEEDIEQAIEIILRTAKGERPLRSSFGAGVRDYVFEPNSAATRHAIESEVRKALIDWEPRVEIDRIEALADETHANLLRIHIDYTVRATNTAFNRVFPFYLQEGVR